MIILGSTSQVLRARLSVAAATTNPAFEFAYGDDGGSPVLAPSRGSLNGTSNVNLVGSPASGVQRCIHSGFIYNADTAAVTITIESYDGTTAYPVTKILLPVGYTLQLGEYGWRVIDTTGADIAASPAASPYDWIVALGDETTAITTGTAKVTMRAPRAMTLTKVKASLSTASSSGLPQFNVKKNGTTIFSTNLTIDASEKTSETAATPAVLSTTAIAADDELTFDIVAGGTGAKGAKITFVGTTP